MIKKPCQLLGLELEQKALKIRPKLIER